ncbi:NlpC/P60 family protein [Sutcliffiella cohnii]
MTNRDLLFISTTTRWKKKGIHRIGHVAIYIGNNKMLHTYRQGKKVKISTINTYWRSVLMCKESFITRREANGQIASLFLFLNQRVFLSYRHTPS